MNTDLRRQNPIMHLELDDDAVASPSAQLMAPGPAEKSSITRRREEVYRASNSDTTVHSMDVSFHEVMHMCRGYVEQMRREYETDCYGESSGHTIQKCYERMSAIIGPVVQQVEVILAENPRPATKNAVLRKMQAELMDVLQVGEGSTVVAPRPITMLVGRIKRALDEWEGVE